MSTLGKVSGSQLVQPPASKSMNAVWIQDPGKRPGESRSRTTLGKFDAINDLTEY